MKITKKLLILGMIFAVVLSFGVLKTTAFAADDDDEYTEVTGDLNNITTDDDDTNTTNTTNTTNATNETNTTNTTTNTVPVKTTNNTTNNVVTLNTTNNTTNTTADKNHPQAGNFTEAKVIAGVSIAVIALAFAFNKMKKYSF